MKFAFTIVAVFLIGIAYSTTVEGAITHPDDTGDTFNSAVHDIEEIVTVSNGITLTITVTFVDPIAAPSLGAANSIGGLIDLDTDQDFMSGAHPFGTFALGNSWINYHVDAGNIPVPMTPLGDEYFVDINSENGGFVDLVETVGFTSPTTVPIIFGLDFYTVIIPLLDLGGDDGLINFGVLAGDLALVLTDRAPNGDEPFRTVLEPAAVPEPASMTLWSLTALGAGVFYRRRRRLAAA